MALHPLWIPDTAPPRAFPDVDFALEEPNGLLALERRLDLDSRGSALMRPLRIAFTFVLTLVGWVFFRSPNVQTAFAYLRAMSLPQEWSLSSPRLAEIPNSAAAFVVIGCLLVWFTPNTWHWRPKPRLSTAIPMTLLLAGCVAVCLSGSYSPFLYFQF